MSSPTMAPASAEPPPPRRVATYASDCDTRQDATLHAYLASRPDWQVVADYHDQGHQRRRPALARALADAQAGRFDVLLVTEPTRLSRRLQTLTNRIHRFDAAGVHVRAVDGALDTSTPAGRFLLTMLTRVAQYLAQIQDAEDRIVAARTATCLRGAPGGGHRRRRRRTDTPRAHRPVEPRSHG